jgi:hypothetical protein
MHQRTQIYTAAHKAELLATQFEKNHNLTTPRMVTSHSKAVDHVVENFWKRQDVDEDEIPRIHTSDVQKLIQKLRPRVSPGDDGITNTLLRHLPSTVIGYLTRLYNVALRLGYFPTMWKHAKVIAIPIPRKPPTEPGSYRPISLLPTFSKILERIVAKRLTRKAIGEGIIPQEQFGFRKRHSTTAQLTRLSDFITHGFNIRKHTRLITLDLEKAYNTVWINGLLFKLINFKFPAYIIKFLRSYLSHRSFSVTLSGVSSPIKYTSAGLPQGAVLSPILFSIYTADFPRIPYIYIYIYIYGTVRR